MKIFDLPNAVKRLKVFIFWGALLFVVQYGSSYLLTTVLGNTGIILAVVVTFLFAAFAGSKTASALKHNTGDNNSSIIYGGIPPVFATIFSWITSYITNMPFNLNFPMAYVVAGLAGAFLLKRIFKSS